MQTIQETADAVERNLARNQRRQVDEWKTARRSPVRAHAPGGVLVERRVGARRRPVRPRDERA
jgi:hypothetical protein